MSQQFDAIAEITERLVGLLDESGETLWIRYFRRALPLVKAYKLAGATHVLGCYGGRDTFSDLVIGEQWESSDPLRFKNLNARLQRERDALFAAANRITSRESW